MKYVVIRCEDRAFPDTGGPALLESARAKHLLQLAQAGAVGVIQIKDRSKEIPLSLHAGCLGIQDKEPESSIGRWYAAALGIELADGETVWCCDFVTHQDGRIIDSGAGGISTAEAGELINALNQELGSPTRRWVSGQGSHHALVLRGEISAEESRRAFTSPRSAIGSSWRRVLPRGQSAGGLRLLMEQAAKVLDAQPVNRVRIDLGENPANLAWIWSPALPASLRSFQERTGRTGAVATSTFALQGLAKALDMTLFERPQGYGEDALTRLEREIRTLVQKHDVTYVHLQVPAKDPVERLISVERVDRFLLKPLTEWLGATQPWRLAVLLDERKSASVAFVAIGTGLPQKPASRLSMDEFSQRGLILRGGPALFDWITQEAVVARQ